MFFKTKIDGIKKGFLIPDDPKQHWLNYHIVKHVILNNKQEQLGEVLKISSNEINEMKLKIKKDFSCSVDQNTLQKDSCNKCTFTRDCKSLLKPAIKKYLNYLEKSTRDDAENPTHAHYSREKTKFSKKMPKSLLLIDKYGSSIILRATSKIYILMTCYRVSKFSNLSDIDLSFKKIMRDSEWIKVKNIDFWNKKFKYEAFKNVEKHLTGNWL